jgi:arsenate reductase-like glutaredoxin family protein
MESGIKLQEDKMTEEEMKKLHSIIDVGIKEAVAQAIERHRQLGQPITIMQNDKVVILSAEEISQIKSQLSTKSINVQQSLSE